MLPEWAEKEEWNPHENLEEQIKLMHFDFTGQRADKFTVHINRGGIEIDRYTITCDECDGTGYYNKLGEIICDTCGLVLVGNEDRKPTVFQEYGGSRGFSDKEDDVYYHGQRGPTGVST